MEDQHAQLLHLRHEMRELALSVREATEEPRKKDIWDKAGTLSGFISGMLVAFIGYYATTVYDARKAKEEIARDTRHLAVLQVQTLGGFLPYLASDDEKMKAAAIIGIEALGNSELAINVAKLYRGTGSTSALTQLAATSSPEVAKSAQAALGQIFADYRASLVRIDIDNQPFSGFFVNRDGLVATTGQAAQRLKPGNYRMRLSDGAPVESEILTIDERRGVALLRAELSGPVLPLPLSTAGVEAGSHVIGLGQTPDEAWRAAVGTVTDANLSVRKLGGDQEKSLTLSHQIETNLKSPGGLRGAPVINAAGEVVGMVQEGGEDRPLSLLIPAADIDATLREMQADGS